MGYYNRLLVAMGYYSRLLVAMGYSTWGLSQIQVSQPPTLMTTISPSDPNSIWEQGLRRWWLGVCLGPRPGLGGGGGVEEERAGAGWELAVLSSLRSWIAVFLLPEKINVFQHGADWERSRPQGPKNVHNLLMAVRKMNSAYGYVTEMLVILKKTIFDLIIRG